MMPGFAPEKLLILIEKESVYEVLSLVNAMVLYPLKSEVDGRTYDYDYGAIVPLEKGRKLKYIGTTFDIGAFPFVAEDRRRSSHLFLPEDDSLGEGEYLVLDTTHFSNLEYLGKKKDDTTVS